MEITGEDLKIINLFESATGVIPSDMVLIDDAIIFLVDGPSLGKAIGKKGVNIQKLRNLLRGKNVLIAKDADDAESFVRGFFNNIEILSFEVREAPGQKVIFITIPDAERGIAIGKGGMRIKAAKEFLKRKFGADLSLKTRRTEQ